MAALAGLRLHEEFRRYSRAIAGLRRTREERAIHSVAFLRLRFRRQVWILYTMRVAPTNFPHRPCRPTHGQHGWEKTCETQRRPPHSSSKQNNDGKRGNDDVRIKQRSEWTRYAGERQKDSKECAGRRDDPTGRSGA